VSGKVRKEKMQIQKYEWKKGMKIRMGKENKRWMKRKQKEKCGRK